MAGEARAQQLDQPQGGGPGAAMQIVPLGQGDAGDGEQRDRFGQSLGQRRGALDARENDGGTALHIAAEYGHAECVTLLLDRGARVDARNSNDATPLHLAAEYGHLEIARALVARGASKDARTRNAGLTPAAMARHFGHEEIAALLSA